MPSRGPELVSAQNVSGVAPAGVMNPVVNLPAAIDNSAGGALGFSLMLACLVWPRGPLPDPLVAGTAGSVAILALGILAALLHLGTAARAVSESRRKQAT